MIRSSAFAGLPALIALLVCCGLVVVLIQRSGIRIDCGRMKSFGRDQRGGVQSLAFVMTFPVFLLLVLFIVQLSQLLIGIGIVQYAAFAAARAASVWIPAEESSAFSSLGDDATAQNELPPFIVPGRPWTLSQSVVDELGSRKCRKIWTAAALACVPIAPSRETPASQSPSPWARSVAGSLTLVVQALDRTSASNARLPRRLANKVAYSFENTTVDLRFEDRSSAPDAGGVATYNPIGHPQVSYLPSEVGWQDPVTVTVRHRFALLPGPGRWLAAGIVNRDGRITVENGLYKTTLSATATMTIDGLQSLQPTPAP